MFNYLSAMLPATVARFGADRRAVTAMEYGVIAALVAVVIIGAVTSVGTALSGTFNTLKASV
jgi:pilus assembly protein Flp/PilA